MTVREAARYQRKQLKGKRLSVKVRYLLSYYRIPLLLTIMAVAVGCSVARSIRQTKPVLLNLYCLNAYSSTDSDPLGELFAEHVGEKPEQKQIGIFCAPYQPEGHVSESALMQTFMTHLTAGEVDLIAGDRSAVSHLAANGCFCSLEEIITPEQMSALAPYLLYVDQDAIDRAFEAESPDMSQIYLGAPAAMEKPIPAVLILPQDAPLLQYYRFPEGDCVIGIPQFSERKAAAAEFLRFCIPDIP